MKTTARVVELKQVPADALGLPPKYTAYVVFTGHIVAGSATVNVGPALYRRLENRLAAGERPELEVELMFEGYR